MAVKLHINPSTGKLSYNAVTGKVQVVAGFVQPNCPNCNPTPETLLVTLSGITSAIAGCTECDIGQSKDRLWSSGVPVINGSFLLTPDTTTSLACRWLYTEAASFSRTIYDSIDGSCTGSSTETQYDAWFIAVHYEAPWWTIFVGARQADDQFLASSFVQDYSFLGTGCAYIDEASLSPGVASTFACFPFYSPTDSATFEVEEVI